MLVVKFGSIYISLSSEDLNAIVEKQVAEDVSKEKQEEQPGQTIYTLPVVKCRVIQKTSTVCTELNDNLTL